MNVDPQTTSLLFIGFSAVSLLIFSVDRLGKRVAIERVEGWLKLLRVTPLPPYIYIAAKLAMTMAILMISLLTIFGIGIFKFGLDQALFQWIFICIVLLISTIPFALIGIAFGYIFSPKAIDPIAGLLIPLGFLSSGLVDTPIQHLLPTISPFYHFTEVVKSLGGVGDDQLLFHLIYLAIFAVVARELAKFAYERDSVS